MIRQLIFYLYICCAFFCESIFAVDPFILAATEGEPSFLVANLVDPISGCCCMSQEDLRVESAVPIVINRTYIQGRWGGDGGWKILPHLVLRLDFLEDNNYEEGIFHDDSHINVFEPSGSCISFKREGRQYSGTFVPALNDECGGVTNTARGIISARTNLKNYKLIEGRKRFTLQLPNGGERIYASRKKHDQAAEYFLEQERLPDGNYYKYCYDKHQRIIEIQSKNPSQTKTYSWVKFHYLDKENNCNVETSDGQSLSYRFQKNNHERYLIDVYGSSTPRLHYDYQQQDLMQQTTESGNFLEFSHYRRGWSDLDGMPVEVFQDDPREGRIKCIAAPNGENGEKINLYRFIYRAHAEGKRKRDWRLDKITDVFDPYGNRTVYLYDDKGHPRSVEYYELRNGTDAPLAQQRFSFGSGQPYGKGELVCKGWIDPVTGNNVARSFSYDSRGNIVEERFWGNLSGRSAPLVLNGDNRPIANGCESYAKRYAYDSKDRMIRCEEDNGRVTTFAFLHDTELLTECFTWLHGKLSKREFYEYNDDRIPVCILEDDGSKPSKNDLEGLTERHIRRFELHPELGLPTVIRELYLDLAANQEVLLSKKVQHYNSRGKVCREDRYIDENALAYTLYATYDDQGRVIEERDPLGQITRCSYTPEGLKTREVSSNGRLTEEFKYDRGGRLIQKKLTTSDNIEQTVHFRLSKLSHLMVSIDPHGHTTSFHFNRSGDRIWMTSPPDSYGQPSSLVSIRDSRGRAIGAVDAEGHTTKTSYNATGQVIRVEHPDGTCEQRIYTLNGLLQESIDQDNLRTVYDYDGFGHEIAKQCYDSGGQLLLQESSVYTAYHCIAHTDSAGNITQFSYDGAGRKIAQRAAVETKIAYDPFGRIGSVMEGNTVTSRCYDLLDQLIEEKVVDLQGGLLLHKKMIYDDAGRVVETQVWDGAWIVQEATLYDGLDRVLQKMDASGRVSRFAYDDHYYNAQRQEVLRVTATDPLGIRTMQTYDPLGRVVEEEIIDTFGKQVAYTEYRYDRNGRKIAEMVAVIGSASSRKVSTLRVWDSRGRLIQLTEAEGTPLQRVTRYTYTAKGLPHTTLKPDGTLLTSHYDALGRCVRQVSSDGSVDYSYAYNALHLITAVEDAIHRARSMRTYDNWGRLVEEDLASGLTFQSALDELGRRTALTLPDGSKILYDYDCARLGAISRVDAQDQTLYTHRYLEYTGRGLLAREALIHNLGEQGYSYDKNGRLIDVQSYYFSQKVSAFDLAGHIASTITDGASRYYTYDALGHISREEGPSNHAYSYDSLHNRLNKDSDTCAVDELNQLIASGNRRYQYDPSGNPISKSADGEEILYSYDALGRLISIEKKMSWRIRYAYDAWHRRLHAITSTYSRGAWYESSEQFFLWDGDCEIGACDAQGTITELRVLGHGFGAEIASAVAIELDGYAYAPVHDAFGNVVKLLSSWWGRTYESYTYTAFGEESSTSHRNPWRYASKRTDPLTGLVYFGQRYYSPEEGRFLTPDPQGLDQGPNLYAFVRNNPLHYLDLFGLMEEGFFDHIQYDPTDDRPPLFFNELGLVLVGLMNVTGLILEATAEHFVPDYLGGGFLRFTGQLFELDPNPSFFADKKSGSFVVGEGQISSKHRLMFTNGIITSRKTALACALEISRLHGNTNVDLPHNNTHGLPLDLLDCLREKCGLTTHAVKRLVKNIRKNIDEMGGVNGGGLITLYAHSEGGLIANLALQQLTPAERNMMIVRTFGSASLFSSELALSVQHFVSKRDGVPMTDGVNYLKALCGKESNVKFVGSAKGFPLIDHGLKGGTYHDVLEELGKKFTKHHGSIR